MPDLQTETVAKVRAAYQAVADATLAIASDPAWDRRSEGGAVYREPHNAKATLTVRPELVADILDAFAEECRRA
jgi:hypothetical protein